MSVTRTFTATNTGDGPVEITDVTVAPEGAGFSVVTEDSLPITLETGESLDMDVTALSVSIGTATATLNVFHTAPGSPSTETLSANFVAPPVTPDSISDLIRWYDISQLTGLTDGSVIDSMPNLATGYPTGLMTGGVSGRVPIYREAIQNGLPGAQMGSDTFLYFVTFNAASLPGQTVIVVYSLTGSAFPGTNGNMASIGGGTGNNWFPTNPSGTDFLEVSGTTMTLNGQPNPSRAAVFGSAAIYGAESSTLITETLIFGDGVGRAPNGYLLESVTYGRVLTSGEFSGLMDYFSLKWGIALP